MRRRYLDRAIFSGDTGYLSIHHEYFKILKNRNALLKSGKTDGLSVGRNRLPMPAARLMESESFIEEIQELFREYYRISLVRKKMPSAVSFTHSKRPPAALSAMLSAMP
jgi:DNA replication and repair protein RecF